MGPSRAWADEIRLSGPTSLLDAILAAGGKGVSQQRYKGLVEVNLARHWKREGRPQRAFAASAAGNPRRFWREFHENSR
jgi:hypothetical protein